MKLYYKSYGSGDPILILHGLFGLGDNWRTIARMLEHEFQCILVDLRNHGRSPHDPVMNYPVMADDVHELMLDLDLDDAVILGHSMGGKVAMQFATTYPELTAKLIVVDMAPKPYPHQHKKVIQAIEAVRPAEIQTRKEAEDILRQYLGADEDTIQFLLKNLSRLPENGFEWKANMPGIIAAYEHLMQDITVMHPYLGPTLFIGGDRSDYVTESDMPSIRHIFPESKLKIVPNAGHWVHADNPASLTQVVRDFLKNENDARN